MTLVYVWLAVAFIVIVVDIVLRVLERRRYRGPLPLDGPHRTKRTRQRSRSGPALGAGHLKR